MTNFKVQENASKLIDEILELTNEETIRSIIDEPIEKTLAGFNFGLKTQSNYQTFIRYTGRLVTALYENIPWSLQKPSERQACAEAMSVLETAYQGSNATGFYAAFLDARNPLLNGPEFVLYQLAEIIKARMRMKYIRWVYASRIEGADWITRCCMAEILIRRWRPFLPSDILMCSPVQFADHISDLIDMLGSTDNMVSEILGTDTGWITHKTHEWD